MHKVEFIVDGEAKLIVNVPDEGGDVIGFDKDGSIKCTEDGNLIFDTRTFKKIKLA